MAPLVWLVTGCSSGLGIHFIRSVLAAGDKAIATCRGDASTRLSDLAALGAATLSLDVTAPEASINAIMHQAIGIYGHVDVLVNNAGYIEGGTFEESDHDLMMQGFMGNFFGPMNVTRALLGHMRARKTGTVLFMGSMVSHTDSPGLAGYTSSKAAIEALVPVLAKEVAPFGIRMSVLISGTYRTSFLSPGVWQSNAPKKIAAYDALNREIAMVHDSWNGAQAGDPSKATDLLVDMVRGQRRATGRELPVWVPLGSDGVYVVRETCKRRLQAIEEWGPIVGATDA